MFRSTSGCAAVVALTATMRTVRFPPHGTGSGWAGNRRTARQSQTGDLPRKVLVATLIFLPLMCLLVYPRSTAVLGWLVP